MWNQRSVRDLLLVIDGVEEVVCLLGAGLAEILVVEFLDVRILVGHAARLVGVFEIEAGHALV